MKKCWPVIKYDLYELCDAFFHENLCMQASTIPISH
jgi:hypothetical protein